MILFNLFKRNKKDSTDWKKECRKYRKKYETLLKEPWLRTQVCLDYAVPIKILEDFIPVMDQSEIETVCMIHELNLEFMERFYEIINWEYLSRNDTLSPQVIRKYYTELKPYISNILKTVGKVLPIDIIEMFDVDTYGRQICVYCTSLDEKYITSHDDKLPKSILACKLYAGAFNVSDEFRSRYYANYSDNVKLLYNEGDK